MSLVSVILTSFNHEKYIREAIESVLGQTFQDFELIVWDDASTDGSWEIVQSYSDPRIKAFRNDRNKGPAFGVNEAISEIATGKYIAITHSDDAWRPEKLEKQVAFLECSPEVGAAFTWVQAIDENGIDVENDWFDRSNQSRWEWLHELFNERNHLNHPSVLIRKACYENVGLYSYALAQIPDAEMWSRVLLAYPIHVMPERLTLHRLFSDKRNTSGIRPEVVVRLNNEWNCLRENFLRLANLADAYCIFSRLPDGACGGGNIKFLLAHVCLHESNSKSAWQLGLRWLLELMSDDQSRKEISDAYGFSYMDYIELSSKYDVYSVGELAARERQITALDLKVQELTLQTQELVGQLAACHEKFGQLSKHWGVRFFSFFQKGLRRLQ